MLLASFRSDHILNLDYSSLFLKAARRGGRDVALLLATRVSNLSVRDGYGNSAVCMAAELVSFQNIRYVHNKQELFRILSDD